MRCVLQSVVLALALAFAGTGCTPEPPYQPPARVNGELGEYQMINLTEDLVMAWREDPATDPAKVLPEGLLEHQRSEIIADAQRRVGQ